MPQVSLYVDEQLMSELRAEAASEGLSLSRHVAQRLREGSRCATPSGLPDGYLDKLYGCLSDDDSLKRPDQLDYSADAPRLVLE